MSKIKKTSKWLEKTMNLIFTSCGLFAVIFVAVITIFLVVNGYPAIQKIGIVDFLFGTTWAPTSANPLYGILPFILTSVYGTFGAIIIGVPIGILSVFLSKFASRKLSKPLESVVDLLAGIPSVVYGLIGMIIIVPTVREVFNLSDGANLFSAIIVLAVMILPSVISISATAIKAVPKEYEEASLALGATKTETIFKVVVPAAKSGIITAVVLGIGRAIGEAMAVMMVSGNVANMPKLFKSVRFLTTAVTSEMSYSSGLQRQALFSIALVLFVFIMLINIALNLLKKRGDGDNE
jgi:phosphate transport system permease protein